MPQCKLELVKVFTHAVWPALEITDKSILPMPWHWCLVSPSRTIATGYIQQLLLSLDTIPTLCLYFAVASWCMCREVCQDMNIPFISLLFCCATAHDVSNIIAVWPVQKLKWTHQASSAGRSTHFFVFLVLRHKKTVAVVGWQCSDVTQNTSVGLVYIIRIFGVLWILWHFFYFLPFLIALFVLLFPVTLRKIIMKTTYFS